VQRHFGKHKPGTYHALKQLPDIIEIVKACFFDIFLKAAPWAGIYSNSAAVSVTPVPPDWLWTEIIFIGVSPLLVFVLLLLLVIIWAIAVLNKWVSLLCACHYWQVLGR
jgi:hypothetical protein